MYTKCLKSKYLIYLNFFRAAKAEKVSSKLNFDDSDSEEDDDDDEDDDASQESKKIPPKIQELRVIVDTTKIDSRKAAGEYNSIF